MKKISFFLAALFAAAVMMVSCTKEPVEPDGPQPPVVDEPTMDELLLGTWDMDCEASTFHEQWVATIDPYEFDYPASDILRSASYTFLEDGTAILETDYYDEGAFTDTLQYELRNDTLYFGADEMYRVTKLDKEQLIWDISGSEEDAEGTYLYAIHFVLNRHQTAPEAR